MASKDLDMHNDNDRFSIARISKIFDEGNENRSCEWTEYFKNKEIRIPYFHKKNGFYVLQTQKKTTNYRK
jgi:hypothetical protein